MSNELERAAAVLAEDPRVLAVYGFGSRARGEAGPRSDVDVAVLLAGPWHERPSLRDELRLRSRVTEALHRDDVDLVILNGAPPLLRFEVVSANGRLFTRDDEASDRWEHRSIMEYLDTAHLRKVQQDYAREARREAVAGAEESS